MRKKLFKLMILNTELRKTDKFVIAYSEGKLTEEEYAPIKAQRQSWFDEINRLEADIKSEGMKGDLL